MIQKMPAPAKAKVADFSDKIMRQLEKIVSVRRSILSENA
jgi:hypothetical protein